MAASRPRRTPLVILPLVAVTALLGPAAHADETTDAHRALSGANGLLQRGLHELAEAEYAAFLEEYPEHAERATAQYGLAVCHFRQQEYAEALAAGTPLAALPTFPFHAEATLIAARSAAALGRHDTAATVLDGARIRDDHVLADDAAALAVESLHRAGRTADALRTARALERRWPESPLRPRAELFRALAFITNGDHRGAAEVLERLRGSDPDGPYVAQAELLHAQCLHHAGALDGARRAYDAAVTRAHPSYLADALFGAASLRLDADPARADALFAQFLDVAPDHAATADALLARGRLAFDRGAYADAAPYFARVAAQPSAPRAAEAAWWHAKCELRDDDPAAAERILARAAESFPDHPLTAELTYDHAVALRRAGRDADALAALDRFLARAPSHALAPDALHLAAAIEHEANAWAASRARCAELLARFPTHDRASAAAFLLAENDYLAGDHDAAREGFTRFLMTYPDDPRHDDALFRFGLALFQLERWDDARRALGDVTDGTATADQFVTGLLALGDIAFHAEAWDDAAGTLTVWLDHPAHDAESEPAALLKLGLAQRRLGRADAAVTTLQELTAHPTVGTLAAQARFELAQTFVELDRPDDAAPLFETVLDSEWSAAAHRHLGAIALARGAYDEADAHLAAGGAPDDHHTAFQRIQALLAAERYSEVIPLLDGFIRRDVEADVRATALAQLVIALSRAGEPARAVETAAGLTPDVRARLAADLRARSDYDLAWSARTLDRIDEAITAYRRLIETGGDASLVAHARVELADLETARGNHQAAAAVLADLATDGGALDPALAAHAAYRFGVAAYQQKQWPDAVDRLEAFAAAHAAHDLAPSARLLAAEAALKSGQARRAEPLLATNAESRRPAPTDGSADVYGTSVLRLGECRAALQHWPASAEAFERFLRDRPDSPLAYQAHFGVAWALENQGRLDDARTRYGTVVSTHQGPTAARAQFQIGECFYAEQKYDDAIRALLKVDILYAYPQWSAAALYEAGRCFEALENRAEARVQYRAVLERDADSDWARLADDRLRALGASDLPGRPNH